MIAVGTRDAGCLATVEPTGAVTLADGSRLDWWVAAEDRWHTPGDEATLRQSHTSGVPVVETSLRVPGGDVVHRVYAEAGGLVVVELENQSNRSVAVAFNRSDLRFARPPAKVPIEGIDLPPDAVVLPLGHSTSVRVGVGAGPGALGHTPGPDEVRRGWMRQIDRSPTLDLPDADLLDRIRRARADVLLGLGWDLADPVERCLAAGELVRLGDRGAVWIEPVVEAVTLVVKAVKRGGAGADEHAAMRRAAEVLAGVGEHRAARDVDALRRRFPPASRPAGNAGVRSLVSTIDGLANGSDGVVTFLSKVDPTWYGQPIEMHDLPLGTGIAGCAVRWHGERPALLWEVPDGFTVRCPGLDPTWSSTAATGEALLSPPP